MGLPWAPSYREIKEDVPWAVVESYLGLKSGQSARRSAELRSGQPFGPLPE